MLVCVQAAVLAALSVAITITAARGRADDAGSAYLLAGFFGLLAAGIGFVGVGLVRGRSWARSPAIAWQLVMLPVGFTLLATQAAVGVATLACAATVAGCVLRDAIRAQGRG